MENKKPPFRKLIPIQEEKFIREVDYDSFSGKSSKECQDFESLEILIRNSTLKEPLQKVLVSIKQRAPAIKTFYISEESSFLPEKAFEKSSRFRLGIGDHRSFNSCFTDEDSFISTSEGYESESESTSLSSCSESSTPATNFYRNRKSSTKKCYMSTQLPLNMNQPRREANIKRTNVPSNVDEEVRRAVFYKLNNRLNKLKQKVLAQEMVCQFLESDDLSSSDESGETNMRSNGSTRPGCSYVQNYSHVPGTSAFQRLAQQTQAKSGSHAITLKKKHNSEQYGRDFTTYDGITARGRRQSASVPCKREEYSKGAAERVNRIRHKLTPVRDYRLMDTVHYLAQGEFAPRDDGIKLTPSREAVLSDIIWEDVCRTHWPNARMPRRGHSDRTSTRGELQRLIDGLLRERVQHVERRRRRHYRIVKLNHRNESCRAVGKTGDIIVAKTSHKSKAVKDEPPLSDHEASTLMARRQWDEQTPRFVPRSHECIAGTARPEECTPGPSRGARGTEPTCCFRTSNTLRIHSRTCMQEKEINTQNLASSESSKIQCMPRKPRLVVSSMGSGSVRRKNSKVEPNLGRYIVLPTLVVRTPSNVRRQKKFNDLYHRILKLHMKNTTNDAAREATPPTKKDIGLNFNITESGWGEDINEEPYPIKDADKRENNVQSDTDDE